MTAIVNVLAGLRAFLIADSATAALVAGRVFVYELPQAEASHMPRAAVVLYPGGGSIGLGHASTLRVGTQRVDVRSYGTTPSDAGAVSRAVHGAMKHMIRARGDISSSGDVLLHGASLVLAALYLRDPDTDWPFVLESWDLQAAEIAVPAP